MEKENMIVTEKNEALIRAFIRVLMDIGVSDEAIGMTVAALETVEQMDAVVDWIEEHPQATEMELIDQTLKITGRA